MWFLPSKKKLKKSYDIDSYYIKNHQSVFITEKL